MGRTLVLTALAMVFVILAPLQTALAIGIGGIVVLVGGYVAVAAMTSAVMLPLLVATKPGVRAPVVIASIAATLVVFSVHRASMRRLRAGEEPRVGRFGNAPLAPGERPGVGWWAKPSPHGLLGRSAMSVGAVFTILAAVAVSLLVAMRVG